MVSIPPLLRLESVSKKFPGVQALSDVSLTLAAGETLAIVGENGAGKSTLLKILGGVERPDAGQIIFDGAPLEIPNVRTALALGIRLIHQELNQAPDLTVAENISLGRQPHRGPRWFPVTNRRQMNAVASEALERLGVPISPHTLIRHLDVAHRQLVEIAKALSTQGRLIIFDEPTSSLSLAETTRLIELVEQLRNRGTAVLYVSHRLEEVVRLADRAMVLRDGRHVATLQRGEFTGQQLASLMVGRNLQRSAPPPANRLPGPPALEVKQLRFAASPHPISFQIAAGEILGVAGIVGAGRSELARAVFGVDRRLGGEVLVGGETVVANRPVNAVRAGLALVPDDRKGLGLFTAMSVGENIGVVARSSPRRRIRYDRRAEIRLAEEFRRELNIRTPWLAQRAARLSGGNQQKIVLAKWLATKPKVLILDEPTRGVDLGARQEIYRIITELAAAGMAVMLISNELEEIIELANRVMVMRRGQIAGELTDGAITEEAIMALAVGIDTCNSPT